MMCSGLTKVVSRLHTISLQWALSSYAEMTSDMVSAGAMFPGNLHLPSHFQKSRGGMFVMARAGAASDSGAWGRGRGGGEFNNEVAFGLRKKSSGAG